MILAAHQPQYLPYPGIFDKMEKADVFVFLDRVQYVRREWQNRKTLRFQRQKRGDGMAQPRLPVRAKALQQQQHANAAK